MTGRGNILESLKHGRELTNAIADRYFDTEKQFSDILEKKEIVVAEQVAAIAKFVESLPEIDRKTYAEIQKRVLSLQRKTDYTGDFTSWVQKHLPVRLEEMIGGH